jgi:hypothetical protein
MINPGSSLAVKPKIAALIINVKSPRVIMLIGKVRIIKIGFIEIFRMPNRAEAINRSLKRLNIIPGIIRQVMAMAIALMNQRSRAECSIFLLRQVSVF